MATRSTTRSARPSTAAPAGVPREAVVALLLATLGFAVNFWAWALLSPLGPRFKDVLALSGSQQALLVAVPVIVGSLGRIPVGALTDRFGGRLMFPAVSALTIVPVLFLGLAGQRSLTALLVGGFFLGIGGTAFAVGVPFVSAIAVLVFLGGFVPLVGATVSGGVAVLVALVAQGPVVALLMLAVVVGVQQVEAQVLQPFLLGRFVSVHPLAVILVIAMGLLVAGVAGALVAVPLVASINAVAQHLSAGTDVGEDPLAAIDDDPVPEEY